jgi:nitroimidazol reductase NimA-like FMN-containing flavoprotein (pyridoxamine 5'-phosphate oxidase superfamily)
MDKKFRDFILKVLDSNRIMTIATNRIDHYPQATIVSYGHDGLILYFFVGRESQKATNIAHDNRVSVAIGQDTNDPLAIESLSLGGIATLVEDEGEIEHARRLLLRKYPEYAGEPEPDLSTIMLVRVTPEVISLLDYSQGFGHTDLVKVSGRDLDDFTEAHRHHWARGD